MAHWQFGIAKLGKLAGPNLPSILTALLEYLTVLQEYLGLFQSPWQGPANIWEGLDLPSHPLATPLLWRIGQEHYYYHKNLHNTRHNINLQCKWCNFVYSHVILIAGSCLSIFILAQICIVYTVYNFAYSSIAIHDHACILKLLGRPYAYGLEPDRTWISANFDCSHVRRTHKEVGCIAIAGGLKHSEIV